MTPGNLAGHALRLAALRRRPLEIHDSTVQAYIIPQESLTGGGASPRIMCDSR